MDMVKILKTYQGTYTEEKVTCPVPLQKGNPWLCLSTGVLYTHKHVCKKYYFSYTNGSMLYTLFSLNNLKDYLILKHTALSHFSTAVSCSVFHCVAELPFIYLNFY